MSDMYDDRGDSEIPWKPPVVAAILGALLVAAFVIYAVVSGPVDDPEADALAVQPVPTKDLPAGYMPLSDIFGVGIKVESVTSEGGFSTVVVSSAVRGTTDPSEFPPPDIAYWQFGPEGDRVAMEHQIASPGAPGTTTIVFPTEVPPPEAYVVAYPVVGSSGIMEEREAGPEMLGDPITFTLEVEPDVAITGSVTVGDGWGYVEWAAPEGMYATLDVAVRFEGTENPAADVLEPIRLVPTYDPSLSRPGTVTTPWPLWDRSGSYALYGDGRSLADSGEVSVIVVEIAGSVVTATDTPAVLDPLQTDG